MRDLKIAVIAFQGNGTTINARLNRFDAGGSTSREKRQHTVPCVGRAEAQPEELLVLWLDALLVCKAAELGRRSMIGFSDGGVESTDATEAGSEGDLGVK